MKTKGLYPERVFYFFEEISKIPRGSKKEEKISNWIVNFAKERNLNVFQDESLNVIIYKPATKGYEEFSPLIIQGHMDMVWEKNRDTVFDFETQGIDLIIENNVIKANKTTLGADNGIAVAYALALLDSNDIKHPALEILITTDEEAGMSGVSNLDPSLFNGHTLLNIDTEDYGEIYVSSAGGSRVKNVFELTKEKIETHTNHHFFSIDVKGLKGGHSGTDIDKNLGNANKILGDILYHITKKYNFNIISLNGGDKMNAIPREAIAILNVDLSTSTSEDFKTLISLATDVFKKEYSKTDSNLEIEVRELNKEYKEQFTSSDSLKIINFLHNFPNGVVSMSKNIENLVETSLNLGVIKASSTKLSIESLLRSSVVSSLTDLENSLIQLSKEYNTVSKVDTAYSPWEYNENSELRILFEEAFTVLTNENPKIMAIHAGLECGILVSKIKNLDVISIGPNIRGAHTPEEYMEIDSVGKTWDVIIKALEIYNIKG